jgi:predicted nuclease of predicted toxin-antitoxin system
MKLLLDMNIPPAWGDALQAAGHSAVHWSKVGSASALDFEILDYARSNGFVLITHDLDFGALLAASKQRGPSVIQLRSDSLAFEVAGAATLSAIERMQEELRQGCLLSIQPGRSRLRILPL